MTVDIDNVPAGVEAEGVAELILSGAFVWENRSRPYVRARNRLRDLVGDEAAQVVGVTEARWEP
jgi:hypothetical protein